ncbi:hypothetical protein [Vibrio sp. MACH09]|uniref:hypothetical protein n=1 Tax=Vibrio sp. MACH09 TaxID=3025122 RepID=UPI00295ED95C|nr:hypothetical protein [Vibrio sp. MACH09]
MKEDSDISFSDSKPCPFCGSSILSEEWALPPWGSRILEKTIVCNDCASCAPEYIWNRRASIKQQEPTKEE